MTVGKLKYLQATHCQEKLLDRNHRHSVGTIVKGCVDYGAVGPLQLSEVRPRKQTDLLAPIFGQTMQRRFGVKVRGVLTNDVAERVKELYDPETGAHGFD